MIQSMPSDRNIEIHHRIHAGMSYAKIAKMFSISAGRAGQIFFRTSRQLGMTGGINDIRRQKPDYLHHLTAWQKHGLAKILEGVAK